MESQASPAQLSHGVALSAMLEDGSFVVAALADNVPETVEVWPNGDASLAWNAAAVTWPLARPAEGARSGFVAVFPLPVRARSAFRSLTLRLAGKPLSLPLKEARGGAEGLFRVLADEAGGSFHTVVDGLVEILLGEGGGPARTRAVVGLVRVAARRAGVVEIVGATGEDALYLQGWAADLKPERLRLLAACEPPLIGDFNCAGYARQDLNGRGAGFAGVFEADVPEGAALRQLFYRADEGWRALELYERHARLKAREIPAHLRSLLPQANGPQDVMARLRTLANRFDGRETVSQVREPVRVGIDFAVRAEAGGVLVAGWLLDPRGLVREVRVCGGGEVARIDGDWSRMGRDDVTDAFAADPLFQGLPLARVPAGFIAFAPRVGGEDAHVEIDLGNGDAPRYFPLTLSSGPPRKALSRLIASVDLRSSAALHAVEHQFGPMLRASETAARTGAVVETFGADAPFEEASVALVIGADEGVGEAASLLAILAADPQARALPIVLAAPAEAIAPVAGEMARLAAFYGLSVRLVETGGGDAFDSMTAGVEACAAETLIVMSGEVLPGAKGWSERLLGTYRQYWARFAVSPTILFEDGSLRWAGAWLEEEDGRNRLAMPHVGLAATMVAGQPVQESAAVTLECCVLSRSAFKAAGGASAAYLGAAARNLDLALRLRVAGTQALWAPDVVMIAAAEAVATQGLQMSRRIDRWALDHRWALPIAGLSG